MALRSAPRQRRLNDPCHYYRPVTKTGHARSVRNEPHSPNEHDARLTGDSMVFTALQNMKRCPRFSGPKSMKNGR